LCARTTCTVGLTVTNLTASGPQEFGTQVALEENRQYTAVFDVLF